MKAEQVVKELQRLGHEEVLELSSDREVAGTARRLVMPRLGPRRLRTWSALHAPRLRMLLEGLQGGGAQELAVRGRLRRLLGDTQGARGDLSRAAKSGSARAWAWLGELEYSRRPATGLAQLKRAVAAGYSARAAALWIGAAEFELMRPARCLVALVSDRRHAAILMRAAALLALKRGKDARRELESAAKDDPNSSCVFVLLGRLNAAEGRLKEAEANYHRVREIESELRGDFLFDALGVPTEFNDPQRAVAALTRALRKRPGSVPLLVERAGELRDPRLCRYDEALEDYARAARLAPKQGWVWAHFARALNLRDGAMGGRKEFDRAVALSPRSGWIRSWRGAALSRAGQDTRALADFAAAEKLMPWYSFSYAWRGALLRRLGRARAAVLDLDTALLLDPSYGFSWNERFQARLEAGDAVGAAIDLLVAHKMNPKYTWTDIRGPERAERELARALRLMPGSAPLRLWRGHARLLAGRPGEAATDLRAAARALPLEAAATAWLGMALAGAGRRAQAAAALSKAQRLDPGSWLAPKALAELHGAVGDWRKALPYLRRAAELAPTTVSVLMEHAVAAAGLGREDEALASARKALGLDPRYEVARRLTARVCLARAEKRRRRGDYSGQLKDFREALATGPEIFAPNERRRLIKILNNVGG